MSTSTKISLPKDCPVLIHDHNMDFHHQTRQQRIQPENKYSEICSSSQKFIWEKNERKLFKDVKIYDNLMNFVKGDKFLKGFFFLRDATRNVNLVCKNRVGFIPFPQNAEWLKLKEKLYNN